MYKLIALFAVIACTSAQVLQYNPLSWGGQQGQPQTINLAQTTRIARPVGAVRAIAPQYAYGGISAPQIAIAAPQIAYAQAPQIALGGRGAWSQNAGLAENYGPPEPYTFGFTSTDEFGTQLGRQESADGSGTVTGSYSLAEADGRQRIVQYVADAAGFRANVQTNEPGTANANPADVVMQSSAQSRR